MALVVVAAAAALLALEGGEVELVPVEAGGHRVGLLAVEQADGLGAQARAADLGEHVVEGVGRLGAGQRDLEVLGLLDGKPEVLAEVLDEEAGLVVALEGLGAEARKRAGAAHAGTDHLEHAGGVQAALLGQRQGVGHADHAACQRDLVAELGRLASAGVIEVEDLGGEGGKDVCHGGGVGLGDAGDKRERAVDGTGLAAGHRAVEGVLVLDLGRVVDVTGELGRGGGEVDEPSALLGGAQQTVTGEVDILDVGRVADHGEDDVGVGRGLGRGRGIVSATGHEAVGLLLGAVVDREVVAGV